MIRKYVITCLVMFVVSASGIAFASDIYKRTDEDGTVHYGDRPTGDVTEERMAIISRATDPAKVQARVESWFASKEPAEEAETGEAEAPTKEELRAQAAERKEKCDASKARLQKFVQSRRLYRHDENGERVYLDEEQTQAARERVENQVKKYCSS